MTLTQAQNINKQFSNFKDSLKQSTEKNKFLTNVVDTAFVKNKIMLDSLTKSYDSLARANRAREIYRSEKIDAMEQVKQIRKDFQRNTLLAFVGLSIFAVIVTLMK